jgi:hypothetical protein
MRAPHRAGRETGHADDEPMQTASIKRPRAASAAIRSRGKSLDLDVLLGN